MKYPLALALVIGSLGCTQEQVSSDQVYVLAFEFWGCEATPQGDCDSGDLFLLPGERFALVDRCISGDTFYSGTYDLKQSQLALRFNRKIVSEIQDNDYNVVGYDDKEIEISQGVFEIEYCNSNVHLVNGKADSGWMNGSRYESEKERQLMTELLESKPWKQLTKD